MVACLWSAIECELSSFYQIFQLRTSFPFIAEDLLSLLFFCYSFYFLSLFFCKYFLSSCRTLSNIFCFPLSLFISQYVAFFHALYLFSRFFPVYLILYVSFFFLFLSLSSYHTLYIFNSVFLSSYLTLLYLFLSISLYVSYSVPLLLPFTLSLLTAFSTLFQLCCCCDVLI